ncbi:MAG: hypothetical protein WCK01_03680 [Candidatus Uhrbacteria bacterium]
MNTALIPTLDAQLALGSSALRWNANFGSVTATSVTTTNFFATNLQATTISATSLILNGQALTVGTPATTATLQVVTNNGASTINTLSLLGGFIGASSTVTSTFTVLGTTALQTLTATNATVTTLGVTTASATQLYVANQLVCLANGTNCPADVDTLATVSANGSFATSTLQLYGGFIGASSTVTSTFTVLGSSNLGTLNASTASFTSESVGSTTSTVWLGFATASGTTLRASSIIVNGSNVCLQNGTNCPGAVSTPSLAQVTAVGATTTATLNLFGGFIGSSSTVTSTFTVLGLTTLGTVTATNVTATNFFATTVSSTNLFAQTGTIGSFTTANATISGGTINNTTIGLTAPAAAVFTNATFTAATTTYLAFTYASGSTLLIAGQNVCLQDGTNCLGSSGGITSSTWQYSGTSNRSFLTTTTQDVLMGGNTTATAGFIWDFGSNGTSSLILGGSTNTNVFVGTSTYGGGMNSMFSVNGNDLFAQGQIGAMGGLFSATSVVTSRSFVVDGSNNAVFGPDAFPNHAASTDNVGLSTYSGGTLKSGLFTEVSGTLLSVSINSSQGGDRVTSTIGAIFRLDTRVGSPYWSLKRQPAGNIQTEISDFQISSDGFFGFGAGHASDLNSFGGLIHIFNASATKDVLVVQGAMGQTASLTEWWNSSSTPMLGVSASGTLDFLTATGTITLATSGTLSITSGPGNSMNLLDLHQPSVGFGASLSAGAFMDRNSAILEEFNTFRTTITADTAGSNGAGMGDGGGWGVYESSTCTASTPADTINGVMRLNSGLNTNGCLVMMDDALRNARLMIAAANLPVLLTKARPSSTSNAQDYYYIGASDSTDGAVVAPTNFIGFGNNGAGTWVGITRNAGAETVVTCTGQTISTTNFALLMTEVRSPSDIRFYVDSDVTNGISFTECGTGSQTNIPSASLAPEIMVQARNGTASASLNFDVDFFRVWQDDGLPGDAPVDGAPNYSSQSSLAQSFPADDVNLAEGTVVSIDTSTSSLKAMPSNNSYDPNFLGVVVGDPGLTLSNGSFDGIRVATQGRVQAFVSNENGNITQGDVLTTASSTGMLMKATGPGPAVGRALASFSSGASSTGSILVMIQPMYYTPSENGAYNVLRAIGYLAVGDVDVPPIGPSAIAQFHGTTNTYLQVNLQNMSTGTQATGDFVVTSDNGNDSSYYIDFGINGSNYSSPDYTIGGPNDGYLYVNGGNLDIGTASATDIIFHTGGTLSENERMRITQDGWVGIGTSTPAAMLDVAGDTRIGGSLLVGGKNVCLQDGTNCPTGTSTLAMITANGAVTYTTLTLAGGFIAGSSTVTSTFTVLGSTSLQDVSVTSLLVGGQHVCLSDGTNCSVGEVTNASSSASTSVGSETEVLALTTTPRAASNAVWISAQARVNNASGAEASAFTLRLRRGATCSGGTQVGVDRTVDVGVSDSDTLSVSFVDLPDTSSAVTYRLCALATGGTPTVENRSMTAQLVNQGADLAEVYYSNEAGLAPGDVVSIDPTADGMVRRSSGAYDSRAIGVISTRPGLLLSESAKAGGQPVMVALSGRVPVKVSGENGAIIPGDYLTASTIPGVAMKATRSGILIGQALNAFDGTGTGEVMAFVKNMHGTGVGIADLDAMGQTFAQGLSVSGTGLTVNFLSASTANIGILNVEQINSPALDVMASGTRALGESLAMQLGLIEAVTTTLDQVQTRLSSLEEVLGPLQASLASSTLNNFTFDDAGSILFSQLAYFRSGIKLDQISPIGDFLTIAGDVKIIGRVTFDKDSGGFAVVHKDQRLVHIAFDRLYNEKPVISATVAFDDPTFATTTADEYFNQDFRIVVLNSSTSGFDILFNKPVSRDITLSWTALAVKDAKTFSSAITIDLPPSPPFEAPVVETPAPVDSTPTSTEIIPPPVDVTPTSTDVVPPPADVVTPPPADVVPPPVEVVPPAPEVVPPPVDVVTPPPADVVTP